MKKYVSSAVLTEYLEQICQKYELPDEFKTVIVNQIQQLKEIYDDKIPRDDFLELFGKQHAALKTGYRKTPVDIEEFLLSREYLSRFHTLKCF